MNAIEVVLTDGGYIAFAGVCATSSGNIFTPAILLMAEARVLLM